jgi:hypothetical protein
MLAHHQWLIVRLGVAPEARLPGGTVNGEVVSMGQGRLRMCQIAAAAACSRGAGAQSTPLPVSC